MFLSTINFSRPVLKTACYFPACISLLVAVSIVAFPQAKESNLVSLLVKQIKLTEAEMAGLSQGRVLARMLKNKDKREVTGLGMIRINISQEEFLKRYRDIASFKQGPEVLQIGKFGNAAKIQDVQELTLDPGDIEDLKSCKPGSCDLKLSTEMIDKLKASALSGADAHEKSNIALRELLVAYVNDYMQRGDAALITYNDDKHPFSVADDFKSLLGGAALLQEYAPELARYLLGYPKAELPGTESFIYWSKEKFGLKPVISITQVVIYQRDVGNRKELLVATKQLFADHYFDSSLGMAIMTQEPADSKLPGNYLVYVNQSRADAIKGFLTGLRRSVVESKSLTTLKTSLKITKERLEKPIVNGGKRQ
ncbi:MAG: hypothetical protein QOH96_3841 [Blastocatellia bacterium]|nr:hypothetical protein [Blastocatellia bacterium]